MTYSNFVSPGVSLQGGGGSGSGTASLPISGNGATVTASTPLINGTQTWNNGAVTFTSLLFNVTDTASAAGSLLMDLQVGGASQSGIDKNGNAHFGTYRGFIGAYGGQTYSGSPAGTTIYLPQLGGFAFYNSNGGSLGAKTIDTILTRRAAANLRLGAADAAAPVAQTLSVQSVVAGTSNTAGANLTITGSQGTGTGAGGSIIFQVAPAGTTGTAQNALATALTIDSTRAATFASSVSTTTGFYTNPSGNSGMINAGANNVGLQAATTISARVSNTPASGDGFSGISSLGITSGISSQPDVILFRDAANTLALRNGTNAQTLNVYNTYTSATNFERFRIVAQSAAAVLIGTEKGSGGGTARALELQTDATSRLTLDTVGSARIVTALTVATLPATPLTGMIARVTDALAPAVGVTVAAGGAAQALCWYNGANWTVIGV